MVFNHGAWAGTVGPSPEAHVYARWFVVLRGRAPSPAALWPRRFQASGARTLRGANISDAPCYPSGFGYRRNRSILEKRRTGGGVAAAPRVNGQSVGRHEHQCLLPVADVRPIAIVHICPGHSREGLPGGKLFLDGYELFP